NAPTAMTVAGPEAALDRLLADPGLNGGTLLGQKLPLRHAFHSRLLEPMLEELAAVADATPHHAALLPVVGNLDGSVVDRHDGAYWRAHARQPVRFAAGLATLRQLGCTHVIELGAQPVLSGFARTAAPELVALPSLSRSRPGAAGQAGVQGAGAQAGAAWQTLLDAAARLWREGASLAWGELQPGRIVDAPGLAFRRQHYWFQSQSPAEAGARGAGASGPAANGTVAPAAITTAQGDHAAQSSFPEPPALLAGERIPLATGETLVRNRLDARRYPFLADHVVLNETIVPGASHVVMLLGASGASLTDVVFAAPLKLPEAGCDTQVIQREDRVELHAASDAGWTLHAAAALAAPSVPEPIDRAAITARCTEDPDGPATLHAMLAERGIALGPTFRGIRRLFRGASEALVEVALPDDEPAIAPLHPAQLDACFQALGATFSGQGVGGAFLPLAIDRVALHRSFHGPLWAHVQARGGSGDVASGDVTLFDADGVPIATIVGLTIKRVGAPADPSARWTYRVSWMPQPDAALALPPVATVADSAAAARDANRPPDAPDLAEDLERLAAAYAATARTQVPARAVVAAYQRLYAHLPHMACATNEPPEPLAAALLARHGERMEIALATRAGRALPGVLRGETDPLSVLFGGDGSAVYADPPFARMLNAMIAAAVQRLLPSGRALRVLEIGAGTGAVLAALRATVPADRLDYTFTDVSPAFLDAAAERFGVATAPLDIERAPEAQGFAAASFDLVIAANVLHATRDLAESVAHAAALLAPHGVLLLLEAARQSNWSDLVFGLTPGWWRFADTTRRPAHPLIGIAAWESLLRTRFGDVATVASGEDGAQMLAIAANPLPARPTLMWEAPTDLAPLDLADAALRVAQEALAQTPPPALRVVTRAAQPVDGPLAPAQSAVLGLGRVIAIEHPELDCRLVDLPTDAPTSIAARIPAAAREAAWRDGTWHLPRLTRAELPRDPLFATSGTHVITGGLGGLGPLLADWLLAHGAARVVLMARRPRDVSLPPGGEVAIGDVSQEAEVRRVFAAIDDLRGVFHLAGSLSDAAVLRLSRDDLAHVFAAKVDGARHLDAVVGNRALDAFVLFGSSAGLIGNPGQGAHAAANAWLAGLAVDRQQRGVKGLCIDWGAWGEAGTLTRSDLGDRLVATGAALMPPADALAAMGRAIVSGETRLFIAAIAWDRFLAGHGDAVPDFFAAVAPARRSTSVADRRSSGDPRASHAALAAFVADAAARVLRAGPDEMPAADVPLNEAGLDSLMALELRKALGSGLDLQLPATLLFNFPTVEALTQHLATLVGLTEADAPAVAPAPPPPPPIAPDRIVETVMQMTEAEMADLIAREFALTVGGRD
ncbi:MAG: polyketide synthase dehydratase domain-containing protein, partial [Rhodospirillales bacterium]|nr:polyketide synthase dehydratase domain-containing protein [Rhodospirillales bacterium]